MSTQVAISLVKRKTSAEILQLRCRVQPGASKSREGVVAITDEAIELCVSAPPQDGKANKAVLEILSEALGAPKSTLQITHGLKCRVKTISVPCISVVHGRSDEVADVIKCIRNRLRPVVPPP